MARLRELPWLRLTAEGVAIVVSILLAFVIDAAWERRGELQEEQEILRGLRAEFVNAESRLSRWADINQLGADLTRRALEDGSTGMPDAAVDSLFSGIWVANVIDRGGGPVDALLGSGRLELIRDIDLRAALARWPDRMEDLHTNDLSFREFIWQQLLPYLAQEGIPDGRCYGEELFCVGEDELPSAHRTLLADPQLRSLLTFRLTGLTIVSADQRDAARAAQEMIELVDRRLDP